ncbi:MAG: DJ-1/PfpI family protein [Clostridia bacterium]|nr:DJ-1/PfpI family protein [Clostridia bacterium]
MLYMILKDGFEETEALATYDFIKRGNIDIVTVGDKDVVTGTHGIKVYTDILFSDIDKEKLTGVILPGGQPGSDNLFNCEKTKELINFSYKENKLICAICAAPYILGEMGLLKGKSATCFPGFESYLKGADILDKKVVRDGNIITAKGMGASFLFGREIVKYFKGEELAEKIMEGIFAK